jgi:hypothetical protein
MRAPSQTRIQKEHEAGWARRYGISVRDLDTVFTALEGSPFRQRFRLGPAERTYLINKGTATVLDHARDFIRDRLAPAQPRNDGKQTPMRGHPVFIAQHATGTCCRSCLAKWHGIAKGHELTADEQAHAVAAIRRWLVDTLGPSV